MNDFKIEITSDPQSAVAGAKATAQALQGTAEAVKSAVDETERYNAALREMATQSKLAQQSQRLAQDDGERYQAALEEMAVRQEAERRSAGGAGDDGWFSGVQDRRAAVIAGLREEGKEGAAANRTIAQEATKAFTSKQQLKQAVRGLAMEFPMLGRLATLALNPIALATAGVAGAFALWTHRVQNAIEVLSGLELPDIGDDKLKQYERAADRMQAFADAMRKTVEAYKSVEAASERVTKNIDKQAAIEQKRLENQKKVDLAQLDFEKAQRETSADKMTDAEYALRKGGIESQYERGEQAIGERAQLRRLAEMSRKQANLEISAANKLRQAGQIRVGSEERETAAEEHHRKLAEDALADKTEREKRVGRLLDMGSSRWSNTLWGPWGAYQYGLTATPDSAIAIERRGIAEDQEIINRYKRFQFFALARDRARERRKELLGEAGKEAGESWKVGQELPVEIADWRQSQQFNRETASANDVSRLAHVATQSSSEQAQLNQAIATQIEHTGASAKKMIDTLEQSQAISAHIIELLESNAAWQQQIEQRLSNLRSR